LLPGALVAQDLLVRPKECWIRGREHQVRRAHDCDEIAPRDAWGILTIQAVARHIGDSAGPIANHGQPEEMVGFFAYRPENYIRVNTR
jgi:hypothetical protein